MEKPNMSNCSDKDFTKWFWENKNDVCLKCTKKCKQSNKVKLINCNNYQGDAQ